MNYNPTPGRIQPVYIAYAPASTSGMAVASLVTGLLGIGLLALVFGVVGFRETEHGQRAGKGMAVAGIVLGVVECVLWFLLLITASAARP